MRKILLTGSSLLLLTAGVALADGHGSQGSQSPSVTVTSIPVVKNSGAGGSGTNSSATSGGVAVSASLSNAANNDGNTTSSNNTANSDNTSVMKVIGSNYAASGSTLLTSSTHNHVDVKLATAMADGSVSGNKVSNMPFKSSMGAGATQSYVNGGTGILTAQQNTGANALQQTSVALGSSIQGSNDTLP